MKKYLFIVSFMMLLKPVIPVFQYAINYDYISQVLCINKEKPEMHCNGKCHLMQELAKASEEDKSASSDKKTQHSDVEILFIETLISFDFGTEKQLAPKETKQFYSNLYSHLNCNSFFHPPSYIS